ncbi:recombinase family protein [Ktedonobacteria bacterium brp13]|nr:recombinase family protein [Ktedonobacteria bacterium brp13]
MKEMNKPKRKKVNQGNIFVTMAKPKIHTMEMPTLPTDEHIALYGRQSTLFQVLNNTQSYDFQVEQQKTIIIKYGWNEELIVEYFQDFAVSGTLGLGERVGITKLTEDIAEGKIKAVYVFLVDRLFRDRNLENVIRFANICQENNVVIITSVRMYYMNNRYDWEYFIEDCKRAWEQFDLQINQRMLPMRVNASHKGYYDSRVSDIGYTVDRDKQSPTFKKYIVHEEQAKVIKWLYNRFIELGGDLPALVRELSAKPGYHFPKYEDPKMHNKCYLMKVEGGYRIGSYQTVKRFLTDETYIDIWKTGDACYENNHEAIIDKYTWDTVQYLLEKRAENASTRRHGEVSIIQGLVIRPSEDCIVSLDTVSNSICFSYTPPTELCPTKYQYIKLSTVEDLFIEIFTKRVQEDENASGIGQSASELYEREQKNKAHLQKTIAGLQTKYDNIYADLNDTEISARMTKQTKLKKYEDLAAIEAEIAELQKQISKPSEGIPIVKLNETLEALRQNYKKLPKDRLRQVINIFTKGIELKELSSHFWGFAIHWEIWGIDKGIIWFKNSSRYDWDDEADNELKRQYEAGATEQEYMQAFPDCSLSSLSTRLWRIVKEWPIPQQNHKPHFKLSLNDMQHAKILEDATGLSLKEIADKKADKVFFMEHIDAANIPMCDECKAGCDTSVPIAVQ